MEEHQRDEGAEENPSLALMLASQKLCPVRVMLEPPDAGVFASSMLLIGACRSNDSTWLKEEARRLAVTDTAHLPGENKDGALHVMAVTDSHCCNSHALPPTRDAAESCPSPANCADTIMTHTWLDVARFLSFTVVGESCAATRASTRPGASKEMSCVEVPPVPASDPPHFASQSEVLKRLATERSACACACERARTHKRLSRVMEYSRAGTADTTTRSDAPVARPAQAARRCMMQAARSD